MQLKVQKCVVWSRSVFLYFLYFFLGLGAIYHPTIKVAKGRLVVVNHWALSHADKTQFQPRRSKLDQIKKIKRRKYYLKSYWIDYQVTIITVYEAGLLKRHLTLNCGIVSVTFVLCYVCSLLGQGCTSSLCIWQPVQSLMSAQCARIFSFTCVRAENY